MCRRKIGKLFAACLGTAMVGVIAMNAAAQNKNPQVKLDPTVPAAAEFGPVAKTDVNDRSYSATPLPAVINRGSPPVGGDCQVANNNNGLNYTAFAIADNFNPSVTGTFTAVSWSAAFRAGTAAPFTNGTPPATESFQIRILADNAGLPGAALYTTTVTNPTRAVSGSNLGNAPALTIYDYTATGLVGGPTLNAGTCYWLEITNTSTLTAPTNVSFWVTAAALPGDSVSYQVGRANCGYQSFDQNATDMTFCINLALNALDLVNCPLVTPPAPSCPNSVANGNGLTSSGGTGIYCVTPVTSTFTGTARFQAAENFQLQTGGNLTSVCFWGFFAQQIAGGRFEACTKAFDITIWNRDPATGGPAATALATRQVNGTTITAVRGIDGNGADVYTVDFSSSPIALQANTCYYLTVSHALVTTDPNRQAVWLWGTVPQNAANPLLDNAIFLRTVSTAGVAGAWQPGSAFGATTFNFAYLLNVGPTIPTTCAVAPPANDTCAAATTLPLTGAIVAGSNVNGQPDLLPGTAFDLVDGPAVWYKFTGTGNDVTITTCNTGTALDTIVHVFCATSCAGPFNRVGGNDDANPACAAAATASTVTVATTNGTQYYVVVNGFQGAQNTFNISATQGAASINPPTCDSLVSCDIAAEPFDVVEPDACGAGTGLDNNNACASATNYPTLGQTGKGSVSTTAGLGGFRDIDLWRMPASANGASVVLHLRAENPVIVQFLNNPTGDCANIPNTNPLTPFTVVPNSNFGIASCLPLGLEIFTVTLPATGTNYLLITTPSFAGSACTQGFDEYRFQVSIPAMGACCLASTACFFTTFADCDAQSAGDPADFWAEAVACAVNPCDSQPGKCCLQDGSCQLVPSATIGNAAACATASGTYTAAGVCTPNTCVVASNVACCRGSSCVLEPAGGCTGPNTFNSGAGACNAAGNFTSPCCKADYNHVGGITVQDIFDFLSGYFTANPNADINGVGGVTVQDIFDFLGGYFAGGCP